MAQEREPALEKIAHMRHVVSNPNDKAQDGASV
jgi:hypothetical protein